MKKKTTLATQCSERLEAAILNGIFLPGQRLRSEALKDFLQTGLSPIREALAKLAERGFLLFEENKGYAVVKKTKAEVLDCMHTLTEIESLCLRFAIEHGNGAWEGSIVAALHRLKLAETVEKAPFADWSASNEAFHTALVSACPLRKLLALRDRCWRQHRWFFALSYQLAMPEMIQANHKDHQTLAKLTLERKKELAEAALRRHITEPTAIMVEKLIENKLVTP